MYINGKWYDEPELRAYVKDLERLLKQSAETIERLGTSAQDCKTCARLTLCNDDCCYRWSGADEAEKLIGGN